MIKPLFCLFKYLGQPEVKSHLSKPVMSHSKNILIKKNTADWITNFIDLKNEIEKGLSGIAYQIEHVGSTSVPNLDAKDIIDMDIIYERESEFEKIKAGFT